MSDSTPKVLYVPLDFGKNVNWFAGVASPDVTVLPACKVRTNQAGWQTFTTWLDQHVTSADYSRIVVGHEPTGIYHESWAYALHHRYGARIDYRWLNPAVVKARRTQLTQGRARKSDPLDLQAITACLRDGLGHPPLLRRGDDLRFELWVTAYQVAQRQQRTLSRLVLGHLDRLWPGALLNVKRFRQAHPDLAPPVPLLTSRPLERQLLRAIIQQAPDPYTWLGFSLSDIEAFVRQHVGRCGPQTAARIAQVVHNAVLPPADLAALVAECLQRDFQRYLALDQDLTSLETQAAALVPTSAAAVLTTVPGISPFLAARYLAHVGHPRRYQTAAQVWAAAGFDPAQSTSGDAHRVSHISKHGDPDFRNTLFLIGFHTSRHCVPIAQAKQRAKTHGKGEIGAILHAAHKANRVCHRLLYDQQVFDPTRYR